MSNAPIARSLLTAYLVGHLVTALADAGVKVGRGTAPPEGGWTGGQPGSGTFVPYVVVKTRPARPFMPEPLGRRTARMGWDCSYQLAVYDRLESKVDDRADDVRAAVVALVGPITLRDVEWTLQHVEVPVLGATQRNGSTEPPYWEVTDEISLRLSR